MIYDENGWAKGAIVEVSELEAMNAKLNALIDQEVGEDVGQMLPGGVDGGCQAAESV